MLAAVDWHIVSQRLFHPDSVFARALWATVYIAVAAQVMGVVLGLIAALMRMSKIWPLRLLSGLYVLVFRGTPLLVQIFFVYFGANLLFGMTNRLAMRRIVLPQAARVVVPPLGNEFNAMLKNTSLVFAIGVYEMFADTEIHYATEFKPVEFFGAVAVWYLVLTGIWSVIQAQVERKLTVSERGEELSFRERVFQAWTPVQ